MKQLLDTEIEFYHSIKSKLLKKYQGQYALIHKNQLIDVFPSEDEAIHTGYKQFGYVPLLVREITDKEPVYELFHVVAS